jgi:hypothetical protein
MRYSRNEKTYISIISVIAILNFFILYVFSFLTDKDYRFNQNVLLNNKINAYMFGNIEFSSIVFLFISFIIILYFILLGIFRGKKESQSNKHFYIAFVINLFFIYSYYPTLSPMYNNVIWYVLRFIGIIFILYIVKICEVGKYIDYKRYYELKINTKSKIHIFSDVDRIILFTFSLISIICFFLLSFHIILMPGGVHNINKVSGFIMGVPSEAGTNKLANPT